MRSGALEVVGTLGRVTADITPDHLGEVLVEVRQGTERVLAHASDSNATIGKRTQVLVVGSVGGRTIEVAPVDLRLRLDAPAADRPASRAAVDEASRLRRE